MNYVLQALLRPDPFEWRGMIFLFTRFYIDLYVLGFFAVTFQCLQFGRKGDRGPIFFYV